MSDQSTHSLPNEETRIASGQEPGQDSGHSVHVEFVGDTHAASSIPAPLQRSGSLRSQFAAILQAHFESSVDAQTTVSGAKDAASAGGLIPSGAAPVRPDGGRFRGVTKHKRTQRYEAHIWQCKKQLYLGGFDSEILAAKSHDIMALRCKGHNCEILNFAVEEYAELLPLLDRLSTEDIVTALRNYSKAQTALRTGLPLTSQLRTLSIAKTPGSPSKPRTPARRLSVTASTPLKTPLPLRRLSVTSPRKRTAPSLSEDEGGEETDDEMWTVGSDSTPRRAPLRRLNLGRKGKMSPAFGLMGAPMSAPEDLQLGYAPTTPLAATLPSHNGAAPVTPPYGLMSDGGKAKDVPIGVAELDSVDLNAVLSCLVAEEPQSLTYSASDESYLFEYMPMDATHTAMEHLSGAVLYQEMPSSPGSPSPDSPTSAFPSDPAAWEEEGGAAAEWGTAGAQPCARQPSQVLSPFAVANFSGIYFQ